MAIDYVFSPANPEGAPVGAAFRARRSGEAGSASFAIGRHVHYKGRYGLSFYGAADDAAYAPVEFPEAGQWAWVMLPTVSVEGQGRFTTLNTYDRAAFTFGFLQFAAHVVDGDFVHWFRKVLALPEARDYFADLRLVDGHIARDSGGNLVRLEDGNSTKGLMAYLNPSGDRLDRPELLATARLIDWTRRSRATRAAQVEVGVETFKKLARQLARSVGLDGVADDICAIAIDILHHGRAGTAWRALIGAALQAPDKRAALLAIGADQWSERVDALRRQINLMIARGELGRHRYDAGSGDFVPIAAGPPTAGLAPASNRLAREIRDRVHFDSAPGANKDVWIEVPEGFDAARPFIVAVYLHGHAVTWYPVEDQLKDGLGQIGLSAKNVVLLAPRFDNNSKPGTFKTAAGFRAFLAEAGEELERLLLAEGFDAVRASAARDAAANTAGVALLAFSGGHAPLAVLLNMGSSWTARLRLSATIDSLYIDAKEALTTLFATGARFVHVVLTGMQQPGVPNETHVNNGPFATLVKPYAEVVSKPDALSGAGVMPVPGVLLSTVGSSHRNIVQVGPPASPIAAMLDLLEGFDRSPPIS